MIIDAFRLRNAVHLQHIDMARSIPWRRIRTEKIQKDNEHEEQYNEVNEVPEKKLRQ